MCLFQEVVLYTAGTNHSVMVKGDVVYSGMAIMISHTVSMKNWPSNLDEDYLGYENFKHE